MRHFWRTASLVVACALGVRVAHADPAALEALLARTRAVTAEVSNVRGLPVKRAVPNDVVDRAELKRRLLALAAEDKTHAETLAEGFALERWGLVPFGTDYEALLVDLLADQIAGYYDPDTKKLTVSASAGDDPAWAEVVLAHEIDHALQDQSFDLNKLTKVPEIEGDALAARHALIEGDGVVLMYEVVLARKGAAPPWSNVAMTDQITRAMDDAAAGSATAGDSLDRAPLAVRDSLVFPYRAGFAFVAALRRRQPWSAVDAAFKRPPRSTEQILHPERYLADDLPVKVDIGPLASLPAAAYPRMHSTVWGEQGFDVFLRAHGVDRTVAAQAAAGWGGDRAVVLAPAADPRAEVGIGIERSEWDSEADAIEAAEALGQAFDHTLGGAALDRTDLRTTWFAVDGTLTWVERRGAAVVVVTGAPVLAATALGSELWARRTR